MWSQHCLFHTNISRAKTPWVPKHSYSPPGLNQVPVIRLAHVPGPPWQPPGILPLGDLNTQSAHDPATPLLISYPKLLKAPRLTAAGRWEWPDCPPAGERVHNTWYIHVMEHHFTVRRNEVLIPATTWMKLKKSCSVKEAGHRRTNTGWFYLK